MPEHKSSSYSTWGCITLILPLVEYYASFCCIQGARNIFDFLPPMFQRYTKQVSLQPFSSIASYCSHCTSSSKEIEKPDFKSGLKLINISFLIGSSLCCHLHKLCSVKKDTKLNQVFCLIKSSEIIFIFYLHFTLLYGS